MREHERDALLYTIAVQTATVGPLPEGALGQSVFIVGDAPPVQTWVWRDRAWVRSDRADAVALPRGPVCEGEVGRLAVGTICRWVLNGGG